MKTITLDYEIYTKEIRDSFTKGRDSLLLNTSRDLLVRVLRNEWDNKLRGEIHQWLMKEEGARNE